MKFFRLGNFIKSCFILALLCLEVWFTPGSALAALSGDCDGNGVVSISEVQSAINMYLGLTPVLSCVDMDGGKTVTISEVQKTINAFLGLTSVVTAKQVTGIVKDAVHGDAAVSGTLVRAYLKGTSSTTAATATTKSDGTFSVTGLIDGQSYYFVFSHSGYGDLAYFNITPSQAADTALDPVGMLQSAVLTETVDINGYINNAADNTGLPDVMLQFRAGIGATDGDLLPLSMSTDGSGHYERQYFPAGVYTASVIDKSVEGHWRTLGYFTVYAVPAVPAYNNSQNCTVSTGTSANDAYRAVLVWGNSPTDLDFHLTGPLAPGDSTTVIGSNDTPRFHINSTQMTYPYGSGVPFSTPTVPGAATDAYLDIDQADHGYDNGSETLTILTQRTGTYRFYVYNNSNPVSNLLGTSGAKVKLYRGATLLQTFAVPVKAGNTWHVFDLDGTTVTAVNTTSSPVDGTYNLAKRIAGSPLDEQLLFKPVAKTPRSR
jgi:uncharacterized protein YfaP (DUF2135 family)